MANTGPKIARDPLELLTNDTTRPEQLINKFWGPLVCGSLTFLGVCFGNYANKRPVLSGIQRNILLVGIGAGIGKYIDDYRRDYFAEKDAVLRHYVQLHPDDFKTPEVKKYAEVLEPWIPIR